LEGTDFEEKILLVQEGQNWLVASIGGRKVTNESVAEMKEYYDKRKK